MIWKIHLGEKKKYRIETGVSPAPSGVWFFGDKSGLRQAAQKLNKLTGF